MPKPGPLILYPVLVVTLQRDVRELSARVQAMI